MVLKFLRLAGLLGVCLIAARGQTTTTAPTTVPTWGICGGIACISCPTTCVEGTVCVKLNDFWFQCQPTPSSTAQPTSAEIGA